MSKTIVNHKVAAYLRTVKVDNVGYQNYPLTELKDRIGGTSTRILSDSDERNVLTALANEDGWEEEKPQQYQAYMKLPGRLSPTSSMYLYAIHGISGKGIAYSYNDDLYKATAASFFTRDELAKYGLTDSVLTIRPVPDKGGDDSATDGDY